MIGSDDLVTHPEATSTWPVRRRQTRQFDRARWGSCGNVRKVGRYQNPLDAFGEDWTNRDIERCLSDQDDRLQFAPLVVSLFGDDCIWAAQVCLQLTTHVNPKIRSNAVEGLGHLARRFSDLVFHDELAEALIAASNDADPEVQAQARSAREDIELYHRQVLIESPDGPVWLGPPRVLEFEYCLAEGTGWSVATIADENSSVTMTASYLSDALRGLIEAVSRIVEGEAEARCSFDEEPGEFRWLFELDGHHVKLDILAFSELWGRRPDAEGRRIFETLQPVSRLATVVLSACQRLLEDIGEDEYERRWHRDPWPSSAIDRLRAGLEGSAI